MDHEPPPSLQFWKNRAREAEAKADLLAVLLDEVQSRAERWERRFWWMLTVILAICGIWVQLHSAQPKTPVQTPPVVVVVIVPPEPWKPSQVPGRSPTSSCDRKNLRRSLSPSELAGGGSAGDVNEPEAGLDASQMTGSTHMQDTGVDGHDISQEP